MDEKVAGGDVVIIPRCGRATPERFGGRYPFFLTVGLGPMGELDQEFNDHFLQMLLFLDGLLAAVDRRRIGSHQSISGPLSTSADRPAAETHRRTWDCCTPYPRYS